MLEKIRFAPLMENAKYYFHYFPYSMITITKKIFISKENK
jgi:hypothetical protein